MLARVSFFNATPPFGRVARTFRYITFPFLRTTPPLLLVGWHIFLFFNCLPSLLACIPLIRKSLIACARLVFATARRTELNSASALVTQILNAQRPTGASKPAKALQCVPMLQGFVHSLHVCAFRDGLLWAAEHAMCNIEFATVLREYASAFAASCDPEFVDQPSEHTVLYFLMLFRALAGMATAPGDMLGAPTPASLRVITAFHDESRARLACGRDLTALTQPLLSSDLSAAVGRETSRVMLADHSTSSSASARRTHSAAFPTSKDARGKAPATHSASYSSATVCRDFARGSCTRVPCRFLHAAAAGGTPMPAPPHPFPRRAA